MGLGFSYSVDAHLTAISIYPIPYTQWVSDDLHDECMMKMCKRKFSRTHRKHHCRFCGSIVCYACSKKRYRSKRICDQCYTKQFYKTMHHIRSITSVDRIAEAKQALMDAIAECQHQQMMWSPPSLKISDGNTQEIHYSVSVTPYGATTPAADIDRDMTGLFTLNDISEFMILSGSSSPHAPLPSLPADSRPLTPRSPRKRSFASTCCSDTTYEASKTFLLLSDDDFMTQNEEDVYQDVPEYDEDGSHIYSVIRCH
eukprot:539925_1